MSKIITYPNPDISKNEQTTLSADVSAGATTLGVINTADFSANDYVVIEQVGNELCEMRQINAIVSVSSMSLLISTSFAHGKLCLVKKTFYDKARLYRSTDNITYSLIATQDIDWQDKYNLITFIDATGSDDYWYKVEYFNTTSLLSWMSSPIKTQTKTGSLTVEEFKNETGIKGDDNFIAQALLYGAQMISRRLYTYRQLKSTTQDTKFLIDNEAHGCIGLTFADNNLDGIVDKNDFVIYEEDTSGVRTYVTSDVLSVDVDRLMITFNSTHPSSDKTLVFEFYFTFRKTTDLTALTRRLNILYAVNYIYGNLPFKRLQRGIGGWTINGVSVDFQLGMLKDVTKNNMEEINRILNDLMRFYVRTTQFRKPVSKPASWIKSTLHWS
jgi:hypothetical protein